MGINRLIATPSLLETWESAITPGPPKTLKPLLTPKTRVVARNHTSKVVGTILPIRQAADVVDHTPDRVLAIMKFACTEKSASVVWDRPLCTASWCKEPGHTEYIASVQPAQYVELPMSRARICRAGQLRWSRGTAGPVDTWRVGIGRPLVDSSVPCFIILLWMQRNLHSVGWRSTRGIRSCTVS